MTNTTNTNPATTANKNIGKVYMPIKAHVPISINFNAPISINLAYNGASEVDPLEEDLKSWVTRKPAPKSYNVPSSKPAASGNNTPNAAIRTDIPIRDRADDTAYRYDAKKGTGCAEATIENKIMDEIVGKFGTRRETLVSITPFKSCYNMYAIGTTGDVTYLAWVRNDGIIVKRQTW